MKKQPVTRMTITCSVDAYRKIGEIAPTQKQTETIRQILESIVYFKGNFYELLAIIGTNKTSKQS
jgi:serine protease inhibitor